eukprot:8526278-Pyramimonas_sp.AAC.1
MGGRGYRRAGSGGGGGATSLGTCRAITGKRAAQLERRAPTTARRPHPERAPRIHPGRARGRR